jgi:hypothetical protein
MTELLASLETYAVAVSALIAAVGVIAALLSAGAAKESARHARRMFEAEQNAERQRLLSQISDVQSQTLVEIGQARLLGVVLMTEHLADREFQDQLERQVQKLDQAHDQTEPLVLESENEKELESAAHDELERLLRESRKQLHQVIGIEKSLELQGRQQVAKRGYRTPASAPSPPLQGHQ